MKLISIGIRKTAVCAALLMGGASQAEDLYELLVTKFGEVNSKLYVSNIPDELYALVTSYVETHTCDLTYTNMSTKRARITCGELPTKKQPILVTFGEHFTVTRFIASNQKIDSYSFKESLPEETEYHLLSNPKGDLECRLTTMLDFYGVSFGSRMLVCIHPSETNAETKTYRFLTHSDKSKELLNQIHFQHTPKTAAWINYAENIVVNIKALEQIRAFDSALLAAGLTPKNTKPFYCSKLGGCVKGYIFKLSDQSYVGIAKISSLPEASQVLRPEDFATINLDHIFLSLAPNGPLGTWITYNRLPSEDELLTLKNKLIGLTNLNAFLGVEQVPFFSLTP